MIVYLYLAIALIVGYFIGNINFARIFSWMFAKKDITTVGSKNPGTMNMLRTRGFGEAFLTLIMEAIKAGGPAIACYFLFEHYFVGFGNLAYFLTAFGAIVGHCYPVFYKFKGGKGVACTFGMFVFHPQLWWVALIVFALCFVLFFFIDYPFVISLTFILTLSIYATCLFAIEQVLWFIPLIVIIWINFLFIVFLHRGNIKRLLSGTENRVHFKDKIFKKHSKSTDLEKTEEKSVEVENKDVKTENPKEELKEEKNDETTAD